jgi:dethiobiotin synthetase
MQPLFITGIGTDVGKTLIAAIVIEALQADYWKPVQAGFETGTDAQQVKRLLSNEVSVVHDELYRLHTPASPHIAARNDGIVIEAELIAQQCGVLAALTGGRRLVVEGAGGLLVPLNENLMVADLIRKLNAKVILVSRNYLGSINHSLLTAAYCKQHGIDVAGWIFSDDYLAYESEIVKWSGIPSLGSVPHLKRVDRYSVRRQAGLLRNKLMEQLGD